VTSYDLDTDNGGLSVISGSVPVNPGRRLLGHRNAERALRLHRQRRKRLGIGIPSIDHGRSPR